MENEIINETTSFCNECKNKERCIEGECVLYRIEQIALKNREFKREVNQELFYEILGDFYEDIAGEKEYENDTFYFSEYDWNEPEEPKPNLYHKPSGFKLWWYKYPLRSPEVNIYINYEQFRAVLYDIKNSIVGYERYVIGTEAKWWLKNE